MIFTSFLETGVFLIHWKRANVVPIHKKESKQLVKNYRPVSLLPICGKVFERLIYNEVYPYLIDNNLISSHQSGFKGGDSCINQLLSITHEIYKSFDEGFEVRGVFLDMSKAFDRVFLKSRKRVVLNGQHSSWRDVNAGVPQGSILGPLLFLVYINDLSNGLKSNPKLFADDTSLFSVIHDVNSSQIDLNEDLDKINNWAYQWKMSFNPDPSKKAQEVIFSRKVNNVLHPPLTFNNVDVGQIRSQKHLGMFLDFK